jgi:hypothetical protein
MDLAPAPGIFVIGRLAAAGVLLGIWAAYLWHLSPSVGVGDSGEFITAAATLSLPHPPSYPLFALAGKAANHAIPWAAPGYRLNAFSAACSVAALALLYGLWRQAGLSLGGALFGTLLAAGVPAFFHNALVTEVFALNTVFCLAVWGALRLGSGGFLLSSYLAGLGLGNHHTLALIFPGWLAALGGLKGFWRGPGGVSAPRRWLLASLLFLLGLSVYAFLSVRSRQEPPLDWGNPETPAGLARTFLRKDYGTFSLSLGDQPPRDPANAFRQVGRFLKGFAGQLSPVGAVLALAGLAALRKKSPPLAMSAASLWFFAGPFFFWLSNLPFDSQSDGILERFMIWPAVAGVWAAAWAWDSLRRKNVWIGAAAFLLPLFLWRGSSQAFSLRQDFLAWDYSRNLFRTLPSGAALFMDGGDDTFFTSAFQQFVHGRRTDLHLFDRGGLIFRSAYGPRFRSLSPEAKEERRRSVERAWLDRGPLYYSTMRENILPGTPQEQDGFLYHATPAPSQRPGRSPTVQRWDLYVFRPLTRAAEHDYRTRALACYFPFMKARALWKDGAHDHAAAALRHAWAVGRDTVWLKSNAVVQGLEFAFDRIQAGDWAQAQALVNFCLRLDPENVTALTYQGTLSEKQDRLDQAVSFYERALRIDPQQTTALYNLAVVHWRRGDWDRVVALLEQVLRQDPHHGQARQYLELARPRARNDSKARGSRQP